VFDGKQCPACAAEAAAEAARQQKALTAQQANETPGCGAIFLLFLLAPLGVPWMWLRKKNWKMTAKIVLTVVLAIIWIPSIYGVAKKGIESIPKKEDIAQANEVLEAAWAAFEENGYLAALKHAEAAKALNPRADTAVLIGSCKNALLTRMDSLVYKKKDAMEGITWIYPKGEDGTIDTKAESVFYAYIGARKDKEPTFRFIAWHPELPPVSWDNIKFLCQYPEEDVIYNLSVSYSEQKRIGLSKYADVPLGSQKRASLASVMEKGRTTDVRFSHYYYKDTADVTMTEEQKAAIRMMLAYCYLLSDTPDESYIALVREFVPDPLGR